MNCFTLVAKCKAFADEFIAETKELHGYCNTINHRKKLPLEFDFPEEYYTKIWEIAYNCKLREYEKLKWDAANVAVDFAKTIATVKAEQDVNGLRYYLISARPPEGITFERFKNDVYAFVKKWEDKWSECTFVFEQKGETPEELGKGFHTHIIIATETLNYYPSHIVRDLKKAFSYIAPQCIKVDKIKNLERAYEYIEGDKKSDAKAPAVKMDALWRSQLGLEASVKYKSRLLQIENQL